MCCYLETADQILRAIIEAMHQTAPEPARRQVADNVLESELKPAEKTLIVDVKSAAIKQEIESGNLAVPFLAAAQRVNPEIQTVQCRVKEPLKLGKIAPAIADVTDRNIT